MAAMLAAGCGLRQIAAATRRKEHDQCLVGHATSLSSTGRRSSGRATGGWTHGLPRRKRPADGGGARGEGCYLRVDDPGPRAGRWAGIARLEMPSGIGRNAAVEAADRAAGRLPGFASALHRHARAPVNVTPIAGLERHLHRLQGDARLALHALREAELEHNREGRTASPWSCSCGATGLHRPKRWAASCLRRGGGSAGPPPAVAGSPSRGRHGPLVDSRTTDVARRTRDSSESRVGAVLVVSRWLVADRRTGRPGLDPTRVSGMPVQVEGACVDT